MKLLLLYYLFAKISIFTFGGGYAMIPLFQDELVTKGQFLNEAEFANMVALAQVTPGPVGLNAATFIGYSQAGFLGSLMATLGLATPSFLLTMLAALFLHKFKESTLMKNVLSGIRPAVVGLIAAAVIFFANTSVFSAPLNSLWTKGRSFGLCWQGTLIFALTLFLQLKYKANMFCLLLLSALLGWLLFLL